MDDELLTQDELLERMKVSRSHLATLRKEGLPTLRLGSPSGAQALRFRWSEVDRWLDRKRDANG